MPAFINGQEQSVFRNGIAQDVFVNGTKAVEAEKEWVRVGASSVVRFYSKIQDIKTDNPYHTLTLPAAITNALMCKFKQRYYCTNTTGVALVRFHKDGSHFSNSVLSDISNDYPVGNFISCIFTNLNGQVLYIVVQGSDNRSRIYRTEDGEHWERVLIIYSRITFHCTLPYLNGTFIEYDYNAVNVYLFDHTAETLKTGIIPPGLLSGFLAYDGRTYIASAPSSKLSAWDTVSGQTFDGSAASPEVNVIMGAYYDTAVNSMVAAGYASSGHSVVANRQSFGKYILDTSSGKFVPYEYYPNVLRAVDNVFLRANRNNFMIGKDGSMAIRQNSSTGNSWLQLNSDGAWSENSPYGHGYNLRYFYLPKN